MTPLRKRLMRVVALAVMVVALTANVAAANDEANPASTRAVRPRAAQRIPRTYGLRQRSPYWPRARHIHRSPPAHRDRRQALPVPARLPLWQSHVCHASAAREEHDGVRARAPLRERGRIRRSRGQPLDAGLRPDTGGARGRPASALRLRARRGRDHRDDRPGSRRAARRRRRRSTRGRRARRREGPRAADLRRWPRPSRSDAEGRRAEASS